MADLKSQGKNVAAKEVYADLDMNFKAHPITGDLTIKKDSDAIKQSIKNIMLTNYYERPFKPSLGGGFRDLLFALDTERRVKRAQRKIKKTIEDFEPRVGGVLPQFVIRGNELHVTINYNIRNGMPNQEVNMTLQRAR
jgi:phage baseplate assembly protein W|tara:strand:- start:190 stop:603 length:414 start_codon:yes stop_codon:yes gene_type:complete